MRVRSNPYGTPTNGTVVRVGPLGQHTHLAVFDENFGQIVHLCRSGVRLGKVPPLYKSNSKFVTCYRCQKLMKMNEG